MQQDYQLEKEKKEKEEKKNNIESMYKKPNEKQEISLPTLTDAFHFGISKYK